MLLPLILAPLVSFHRQGPAQIELFRGAAIAGALPRYWAVEDTTLDNTQSDINQGWQTELNGDEGKNILIQFRDLNRAIGPGKKIVKASLVFAISGGDRVAFKGIRQVLVPWNEGPEKTLMSLAPAAGEDTGARWSATYRHRRTGQDGIAWDKAGALGEGDSKPLPEAKAGQPDQDHVEISGLENAVEQDYESPQDNHGFVIQFSAPIAVLSSKASKGKPKLVLQVEDARSKGGADLSVTYIERKPDYQRYDSVGGFTSADQDGQPVAVLDHPVNAMTRKWPSDGEDLTYVAHIKNVGSAPAQGFTARWYLKEKPGDPVEFAQTVNPGEETSVVTHIPYKNIHTDHRVQPIGISIQPKGADAVAANNFLEIQESGLNIAAYVEKSFYDSASKVETATGSTSFEDWLQQQVGLLNHVYFPYSRFSFATDGVRERLRIGRITIVPDGTLQGKWATPGGKESLAFDAEVGFSAKDADDLNRLGAQADIPLLKRICNQIGLADLGATSYPSGNSNLQVAKEGVVNQGTEDMFPGLMGGGDTRDESKLPPSFAVPYQPFPDPVVEEAKLVPTDLLSATEVAGLESDLGKRRGHIGDYLYDTPTSVDLRVLDYNGKKLPNTKLTFYQMVNGSFSNSPAFTVTTSATGVAGLFQRDPLARGSAASTSTGHSLVSNPFGRIDYNGFNGTFLVKAEAAGMVAWSPFKVWQLVDTAHRGQKTIALMSIAFNLPSDPLDSTENVAKGKSATDSANDPATALAGLIDESYSREVSVPSGTGSYVEIDLGRDRTVGEIRLASKGPFWPQFELRTYSTGQKPNEAQVWSREVNWGWSFRNRAQADLAHSGVVSVPYRGPAQRFRFIRIVNTGADAEAKLVQVLATPIKQ